MRPLKSLLLTLLFLLILHPIPITAQTSDDEDAIIVIKHNWQNFPETEIGKLLPIGNNTYVGTIDTQYMILLKYKGVTYHVKDWVGQFTIGETYEFKKDYYQNIWFGNDIAKYTLRAVLSDDKSTISLEVPQPIPLTANIGSSKITLAKDVNGSNQTYTYSEVITVSNNKEKTISNISVDGKTYGVSSQPTFTTSKEAQSQKLMLVENGSDVKLTVNGNYKLSIRLENGIPVEIILNKAEVVPEVIVNSSMFEYQDGKYSGTITLRKSSEPEIIYDNNKKYYIGADIIGSIENPSGSVSLGTSNKGCKVINRGTYEIVIDMTAKTLTYTNTTPPKPSSLSSTIPEAMVDCENTASYIPDEPMTLWYNEEINKDNVEVGNYGAQYFEVFLLGNGRLGMATNCGSSEGILINEKTNYDSNVDKGHETAATGNYNPIGFIQMKQAGEKAAWGGTYLRQLDLTTAVASSVNKWTTNDVEKIYGREYLVSQPDNVGVVHFTTNGEVKLSYNFSSSLSGTASDGLFSATTSNTSNCDIHFNLSFKIIQSGGTLTSNGGTISVTDADEITMIYTVVTNYDINNAPECYSGESDAQLAEKGKSIVEKAASLGWKTLYDNHIAEYSPLFNSVKFQLENADNDAPVKTMKAEYEDKFTDDGIIDSNHTRMIDMLLFGMGRYLNLASSRGEMPLPSNLQGIWANTDPAWNCDYHANINLQMNYWATENTNISSAHMPFLNYLKIMAAKRWTKYADSVVPNTGGWAVDFATNTFGTTQILYNNRNLEAAGWNCSHIWQHYLYTQDKQFLSDFFDTLYGSCKFYFGYLKDTDNDGLFEIPNTYSPEIGMGSNVAVHAQQIVYQHLCNTRDAAEILGKTAEMQKCQEFIDKMFNGIDIKDGYQCEWKGELTSEPNHRHLSHIMFLYPFAQVSPYDENTTNFDAFYNSLLQRGDTDGGEDAAWNTAWKMNCYARALKGDLALRQLAYGMKDRITPDLRTTCKHTFQIEGGAGISAGIAEMLLQSYSGIIDILPALPTAWQGGTIKGLKAVGNFEVEITWKDGTLVEAKITDCLNSAMREGVKVRIHESNIPDIKMLRVNKQKSTLRSRAAGGATHYREENTGTYVVEIPAGAPKTTVINFSNSSTSGIDDIQVDEEDDNSGKPVEYFDLQGRRVSHPAPGIYIRRQGTKAEKILIR